MVGTLAYAHVHRHLNIQKGFVHFPVGTVYNKKHSPQIKQWEFRFLQSVSSKISYLTVTKEIILRLYTVVKNFFQNEWIFHSVSLVYVPVFMPVWYHIDSYNFVICFEVRKCDTFSFFFFLRNALAIWGCVCVCVCVCVCGSVWTLGLFLCKNAIGIFIEVELNL